jgi:hypothetical protein
MGHELGHDALVGVFLEVVAGVWKWQHVCVREISEP